MKSSGDKYYFFVVLLNTFRTTEKHFTINKTLGYVKLKSYCEYCEIKKRKNRGNNMEK